VKRLRATSGGYEDALSVLEVARYIDRNVASSSSFRNGPGLEVEIES
jgi:hypothetical protein